jgi:hypothetical protein
VVDYGGRYTHRVAISNHRIVDIEGGKVKFTWRDCRDNNPWPGPAGRAFFAAYPRHFMIHSARSPFVLAKNSKPLSQPSSLI